MKHIYKIVRQLVQMEWSVVTRCVLEAIMRFGQVPTEALPVLPDIYSVDIFSCARVHIVGSILQLLGKVDDMNIDCISTEEMTSVAGQKLDGAKQVQDGIGVWGLLQFRSELAFVDGWVSVFQELKNDGVFLGV